MNIVDIIVLILLIYAIIRGFVKGFIKEISGMIALVIGLIGSLKFSTVLGKKIGPYLDFNTKSIQIISFILLFLVIIYSISLLAKMITKTLKLIALGWINRILGGLFGFLKWLIILSAFILFFKEVNEVITVLPKSSFNASKSYPFLKEFGNFLFDWVTKSASIQEQQFI